MVYLAVDTERNAHVSASGASWAKRGAVGVNPDAAAMFGGRWYVISHGDEAPSTRTIRRASTAASTWETAHTFAVSGGFADLAAGRGRLVAACGNAIAVTADGATWQDIPVAYTVRGVRLIHGRWFVQARSGAGAGLLVSSDATTWTYVQLVAGSAFGDSWPVVWDGSRYIYASLGGQTLSSLDGLTWTANADLGLGSGPAQWAEVRDQSILVGISAGGTSLGATYLSRNGGASWANVGLPFHSSSAPAQSFFRRNVMALPTGWWAYDLFGGYVTRKSADGAAWVTAALPGVAPVFPRFGQAAPLDTLFMQNERDNRLYRYDGTSWAEVYRPAAAFDVIAGVTRIEPTVRIGDGAGATRFHQGGRHGL